MDHNTIAIIPARSGSKGIPNKNLMQLAGRSILDWTASAAAQVLGAENVVVSSDGDAILDEARKLGVRAHRRSAEASSDTASSEMAILEVLADLKSEGIEPERLLFMQCTSPCVLPEDLQGLIEIFDSRKLDSAFMATESHAFLWEESENQQAVGVNHDWRERKRRQDIGKQYRENGTAYLVSTEGFLQSKHRFFGNCGLYEMPAERSWEIDSYEDAIIVEALLKARESTEAMKFDWCQAVVFDFDGVLTDNAVYLNEEGVESVRCDRGDGFGFELARKVGLRTLILSKERNKVVSARAAKLQCEVAQGIDDKPTVLAAWLDQHDLSWNDIVYVGNDLNDLDCIKKARVGVAVADAVPTVLDTAELVLSRPGGHGAVRELLELILRDADKK